MGPRVEQHRDDDAALYLAFPRGSSLVGDEGGKGSTVLSLSRTTPPDARGSTVSSPSASSSLFPPLLAWSHYLVLLRVQHEQARAFYEIEAARESWSVRELERQIASLLFERLSMNRDLVDDLVASYRRRVFSS